MKNLLHAFYYPAGFNYLAIQNPAQIDDQRDCAWIEIFLIIWGDSSHTSTEWNKHTLLENGTLVPAR